MADGGSNSIADQDTVSFNSIDPVPEHDLTSDSAPGYLGLFDLKNARTNRIGINAHRVRVNTGSRYEQEPPKEQKKVAEKPKDGQDKPQQAKKEKKKGTI